MRLRLWPRSRIIQLTYKAFADAAGPSSATPESMLALVKSELGSTVARYFDSDALPAQEDPEAPPGRS
jgi:hypothetical protein